MLKKKLLVMVVVVCMIFTSAVPVMAKSPGDGTLENEVNTQNPIGFQNVGDEHTIKLKEKLRLDVKQLEPLGDIEFETSNKKIVSVSSDGEIKGLKKGSATIKATNITTNTLIDSVKITVGTRVSKVSWDSSKNNKNVVYMGRTLSLKVKISPATASNKKMIFEGMDNSIATVSKAGTVTPIKNGTLVVKGTTTDGSKKSIETKITVKTYVSDIQAKPEVSTKYGFFKDETFKMKTISVGPETASDKEVYYKSLTPKTLSVSKGGNVRPVSPGKGIISVNSKDGHFTKTYKVKVLKDLTIKDFYFTAHRGLSGEHPENTVEAIKAASDAGMQSIETDIWTIKDANGNYQFICMHDKNLKRMTGYDILSTDVIYENLKTDYRYNVKNINDSEDQTQYKIPTIEEAMTAAADKQIIIEIKEDLFSVEQSKALIMKVQQQRPLTNVKFISFRKPSLNSLNQAAAEMGVTITTGINLSRTAYREGLKSYFDWAKSNNINEINLNYKYVNESIIKEVHDKYKMKINVGTIDDPRIGAYYFSLGADTVTTNTQIFKR
ncbi:MAG: Ig-like domain-containing protein [Anaerovoracaceae bacterium]